MKPLRVIIAVSLGIGVFLLILIPILLGVAGLLSLGGDQAAATGLRVTTYVAASLAATDFVCLLLALAVWILGER